MEIKCEICERDTRLLIKDMLYSGSRSIFICSNCLMNARMVHIITAIKRLSEPEKAIMKQRVIEFERLNDLELAEYEKTEHPE